MKALKKVLAVAALALCLTVATKVDSQAAGQVTGLKQTSASDSSVNVSWDSYLGAQKYYVRISDGQRYIDDNAYLSTDDNIGRLSAGTSYAAAVIAYDSDNNVIAQSEPIEVVTAPSTTGISVTQSAATTNSVSLTFANVTGANAYIVTNGYGNAATIVGSSATPTVTISGLAPGISATLHGHPARVSATGFIAYESYGKTCYVKSLMNKLNSKEFGIRNIWANINSYHFAINSAANRDGIQFEFATMAGKVKRTQESSGSYVGVSGFINGTFYKYRVRTYVTCGSGRAYSAWSDYKYIGMSKSFKGTSSKKAIRANWSKVNGATKYVVYVSTKENSGYKKVKTVSAKKRSVSITKVNKKKLKKGKKYYVKVVAQSKAGKKTVSSDAFWRGDTTIPRY